MKIAHLIRGYIFEILLNKNEQFSLNNFLLFRNDYWRHYGASVEILREFVDKFNAYNEKSRIPHSGYQLFVYNFITFFLQHITISKDIFFDDLIADAINGKSTSRRSE